jgi:2-oxoglutarate ferredoxin oxidoreductase subunit delta
MTHMNTTNDDMVMKQLPSFSLARCKRCGICSHFCPVKAIATRDDGMPYLANPEKCTSCGSCSDLCPDWAVSPEPTPMESPQNTTIIREAGD